MAFDASESGRTIYADGDIDVTPILSRLEARMATKDLLSAESYSFANERDNLVEPLKPLKELQQGPLPKDAPPDTQILSDRRINTILENQFSYLSRTSELEVNSSRTRHLQDIVDKMLDGTSTQARVVIMNKGRAPNAFVYPDGTIFISQSLLNVFDHTDEIGAVLAHEVNHLLHKTAEKVYMARDPVESLTLGWLHEIAADAQTTKLLEKANLNSRAFESAIQKVSTASRDFAHQTGLSRAVQMAGKHYILDSKTSDNPLTPLSQELKRNSILPTNKEQLDVLLKDIENNPKQLQILADNLHNLHGKDFESALQALKLYFETSSPHFNYFETAKKTFAQQYRRELLYRMSRSGISDQDIQLYELASTHNSKMRPLYAGYDPKLCTDETTLMAILPALERYSSERKTNVIHHTVFETAINPSLHNPTTYTQFIEYLADLEIEYDKAFSVSSSSWVQTIGFLDARLKQLRSDDTHADVPSSELVEIENNAYHSLQQMFMNYPKYHFLHSEGSLDEAAVTEYFQTARSMNIFINRVTQNQLERLFTKGNPREQRYAQLIAEAYDLNLAKEEEVKPTFESFLVNTFGNPASPDYMKSYKLEEYLLDEPRPQGSEKMGRIQQLFEIVDRLKLVTEDDPLAYLDRSKKPLVRDIEQGEHITRFTLKMRILKRLYQGIDTDFFVTVDKLMQDSKIDTANLSPIQLANLSLLVLETHGTNSRSNQHKYDDLYNNTKSSGIHLKADQYDQLMQLSFVKELQSKLAQIEVPTDVQGFQTYIHEFSRACHALFKTSDLLYGDSVVALVIGQHVREAFPQILTSDIPVEDYDTLYSTIKRLLPDSVLKDSFLKRIRLQFFESLEVSLEAKIDYLEKNFDEIGAEGMLFLGDQITTHADYIVLRKRMGTKLQTYLSSAGTALTKVAAGDYVTSFFTKEFAHVFQSANTDPAARATVNTTMAKLWSKENIHGESSHSSKTYYPDLNKISISDYQRGSFRSYQDFVEQMQNLSSVERFGVAMKLLTDSHGALSSPESRTTLATLVTDAINVKPGFIQQVLQTAIKSGDRKLIGLFNTKMLAPLLFRGLDSKDVNTQQILKDLPDVKKQVQHPDTLQTLLSAPTHDIILFGAQYAKDPTSTLAVLARDSDLRFRSTLDLLDAVLPQTQITEVTTTNSEIDPALEAIISGIESSSSLGARSLQLARQLNRFSPEIEKRLSQTLDSNPGLQKLYVWENLTNWMEEDPEIARFMNDEVESIHEYLGGGSLFTTLAVSLRSENGAAHPAVIKILNPNAISIIKENYLATQEVLQKFRAESNGKWDREITSVEILIDLAHRWALADINDPNFMHDDTAFRSIISTYKGSKFKLTAPTVTFNSMKVKSEMRADGRTVNKILDDPQVSQEYKRSIVTDLGKFMVHQLESAPIPDSQGTMHSLFHSDPHVGNYVLDESSDTLAVIDRSMYLKLSAAEVTVMKAFVYEKDNKKFLNSLLDTILDANKVSGFLDRNAIKGSVLVAVAKEYLSQKNASPQERNYRMMQKALSHLPKHVTVPLDMLLMIKNIAGMGELLERHQLSWDDVTS